MIPKLQRSQSTLGGMSFSSLSFRRATSVDSGEKQPAPLEQESQCNILLLGKLGVGKSALTVKYLTHRFISEYHSLLEGMYTKQEVIDQEDVIVKIYDTGFPIENPEAAWQHYQEYIQWADAIIIIFSVDNMESFEFARDLLRASNRLELSRSIVLVGNKMDLEWNREVEKDEIDKLLLEYDVLYQETTSCCEYEKVSSLFHNAVRSVRRRNQTSSMFAPSDRYNNSETPTSEQKSVSWSVSSTPRSSVTSPPGSISPSMCYITEESLWEIDGEQINKEASRKRYLEIARLRRMELKRSDLSLPDKLTVQSKRNDVSNITNNPTLSSSKKSVNGKKFTRKNSAFSLLNNKFKIF